MRMASTAGIVMAIVLWCGTDAHADQSPACVTSDNIETSQELIRMMRRLSEQSPTFKRQCHLIGAAPQLRVSIGIDPHIPRKCRAFTVFHRNGRQLRARVHLPPSANHAELIAHEFEHVIEQLEGLDLPQLAQVRGSGVRELEGELFETARAQAAGRTVAAEARRRVIPAAD